MLSQVEKVNESIEYIKKQGVTSPKVGIILGTGLAQLGSEIEDQKIISYENIPHFPVSTVESHTGQLIFGKLGDKDVVAMQGRFHFYEGYSGEEITFAVRVMKELGIKALFVSNACGGLNPNYSSGCLMRLEDHINMLGFNPLVGKNNEEWGPRFPDMSEPYSKVLGALAHKVALKEQIDLKQGVYLAVSGPNLETRAEYRMTRLMGADVVGMSTIPEVIVARHMGIPVLAISVITDMCLPDNLKEATVEQIIAVASKAEPFLTTVFKGVIAELDLDSL
ncbi:MAG: purine-nucleoside phosphorylase [Candidatus Cloacimonadota bacterium]|nr:MAG: purine-nucleoside phosphorylase [Candidatus Cloacimonadota bacterium]